MLTNLYLVVGALLCAGLQISRSLSSIHQFTNDLAMVVLEGKIDLNEMESTVSDAGLHFDAGDVDFALEKFVQEDPFNVAQDLKMKRIGKSRTKRGVSISTPLHYVELGLGSSAVINTTQFSSLQDKHFSHSFQLSPSGTSEQISFIILDKDIYKISLGRLVKLDCASCSFTYENSDVKVTRTEVIPGEESNVAYVVQVTLRDKKDEHFSEAHFTLWKISLTSALNEEPVLRVENLEDFQIVRSDGFLPEQSVSRISVLSVPGVGIFIATFHKLTTGPVANGLHLLLKDSSESTQVLTGSEHHFFENTALKTDLRDLELINIFSENIYMLVVANGMYNYIFNLRKNDASYVLELLQKSPGGDVRHIYFNNDNVGNFLTFVNNDGSADTMIYDGVGFIKVQSYEFGIEYESWKSVETSLNLDLPTQDLVVAKSNNKMIFLHHVMPGIYEALNNPLDLPKYKDFIILDLSRKTDKHGDFEYFLLIQRGNSIDYIRISLDPRPHTIVHLNDVSICLVDLENTMQVDNDLSDKIDQVTNNLIQIHEKLDNLTVTADFTQILGDAGLTNLTIVFETDLHIKFEHLDYTEPKSSLSLDYSLAEQKDTSPKHLFSNSLFSNGPFNPSSTFNITAPQVTVQNGSFTVLDVANFGNFLSEDLWHVLSVSGNQTIIPKMIFNAGLITSNTTTVEHAAQSTFEALVIDPDNFIDLQKSNTIDSKLNVAGIEFHDQQKLKTLNGIGVSDIITLLEMSSSTSDDPVVVNGDKSFESNINTFSLDFDFVNNENLSVWFDNLIFKNLPEQRVECSTFEYRSIDVVGDVTLKRLNGRDFTEEALDDLARDDRHAVISGDIGYDELSIVAFSTVSLNGSNPNHYLKNNTAQTINANMNVNILEVDKVHSLVNGMNISNSAQTNKENVVNSPVHHNNYLTVKRNVTLGDGVKLNDIDFSEVNPLIQKYDGTVNVRNRIEISDSDVTVELLDLNGTKIDEFNEAGLEETFLMKDTNQTLEFLHSVSQNITANRFVINTTIDDIELRNVMRTTGNQDVDAKNIDFTGTTVFHNNILVQDWVTPVQNSDFATINNIFIKDLVENIFCDKDNATILGTGALNVTDENAMIKVHFDIKITESFKVLADNETVKDYGAFDNEVVKLRSTNTFTEKVTMPKINIDGDLVSNVNLEGPDNAMLNSRDFLKFLSSIVNKTGPFNVLTNVTVNSLFGSGLVQKESTFDDEILSQHYLDYIIKDKGSSQEIRATLTAKSFLFANLILVPQSGDLNYFSGIDILDYTNNHLFKSQDVMLGMKVLTGALNVGGDMHIKNGTNENFFFGIDLRNLADKALSKSKDQIISSEVKMKDFSAGTIFVHEVNGVEMNTICFKHEHCPLKANTVEIMNSTVTFETGVTVNELINGMHPEQIPINLSERKINEISNLTVKNYPAFLQNPVNDFVFSNLLDNSVKISLVDQTISNAIFNARVETENFDIITNTINEGLDSEINLTTMFTDAAFLDKGNKFNSSKVVKEIIVGNSIEMDSLSGTELLTGINLTEFMSSILVRNNNSGFVQDVTGIYTLSNSLKVLEVTDVDLLDGIKDSDFVLQTVVEPDRQISGLVLKTDSIVSGSVLSSSSLLKEKLSNLLSTSMRTCHVDILQNVTKDIKFLNDLLVDNVNIEMLNDIKMSEFVLTDSTNIQHINQNISLPQKKLEIDGSLMVDFVNTVNLTLQYTDALLINREENVTIPVSVHFLKNMTTSSNNITIEGVSSRITVDMINVLGNFTENLLVYYLQNVARPLKPVIQEIFVANRVGSRRLEFFDTIFYNTSGFLSASDLIGDHTILGIEAVNSDKESYTMKIRRGLSGSACQTGDSCTCQVTRLSNMNDGMLSVHDFEETVYNFKLAHNIITATSQYRGTSDQCNTQAGNSSLKLETVQLDTSSLQVQLGGASAKSLGSVYVPDFVLGIYEVLDILAFTLGGLPYLAVATGYSPHQPPTLLILQLTGSDWSLSKNMTLQGPAQQIDSISFRKMEGDSEIEVVHLFIAEQVSNKMETGVSVFEWSYNVRDASTLQDGVNIQIISTPGLTSLEVFKQRAGEDSQDNILLAVGYEFEENLLNHVFMDVFRYSVLDGVYDYAVEEIKHYPLGHQSITKIKSKKISDYTNLIVSFDDKLMFYDFVPNFGLQFVREFSITGKIVDWTIFTDSLPRSESAENFTFIILLIIENVGVRTTRTVQVCMDGSFLIPEIVHDSDKLGF